MTHHRISRLIVLIIFLMPMTTATSMASSDQSIMYKDVRRTVLDNGLIVLMQPSSKADTASIYLGVQTGAANEHKWLGAGLSHFVEHLFFKGTSKRNKGKLEQDVRSMGGYINAYTSHDLTVFYLNFLAPHINDAIDLMYDATFHPLFDQSELEREKDVILAEQRMNEDRLSRKALVTLWESLFLRHPYKHPVIGYPEVFKDITRQDLLDFYSTYYIPNNMVLSVVGNFDPDLTLKLIRDTFGTIPRKKLLKPGHEIELDQIAPRSRIVEKPAQHTRLMLGFRSTPYMHDDSPALDVLASILGQGNHSRLYQNIKENNHNVLEISAFNSNMLEAGLFAVDALIVPGEEKVVQQAIIEEIEKIISDGISSDELDIARTQILSHYYDNWDTHSSIAHNLMLSEIYAGDYAYASKYLNTLQEITPDNLRIVAKKYLNMQKLNNILLIPKKDSKSIEIHSKEASLPVPTSIDSELNMKKLDNGLRVLKNRTAAVPLIHVQISMLGGLLSETHLTNGISALTIESLIRGTAELSQKQIATNLAKWGADLSAYSGQNSYGIILTALSKYQEPVLDFLKQLLLQPAFRQDDFEKVLSDQKQALSAEKENIYAYASRLFLEHLYGEHPYNLNPLGNTESLDLLSVDNVRKHYGAMLNPKNTLISIFGDFDSQIVNEWSSELQAIDPSLSNSVELHQPSNDLKKSKLVHELLPREQSVVMLGFKGTSLLDEDRYALEIINTILSGSAGRLYQNIRDKHGLSYVIHSQLSFGINPGYLVLYAGVQPGEEERTMQLFEAEVQSLIEEGVSNDELESARIQLIGNHEHVLESTPSFMRDVSSDELFGLGLIEHKLYSTKIQEVSRETISNIIRKYFVLDKSVKIIVEGKTADANAKS